MNNLRAVLKNGETATLAEETIADLKTQMRGEVLTPQSADYDEVRVIWNGLYHDKRPAIIARCTGVADVIDAVNFARENNLLVAVRGGGHNVAGSSSCDGGIMIDLSLMTGVHVDKKAKTARVQGGATWGDVDRETQVFGLATPGGIVSTTGVAGLTLGGGLGWLRNKYGLTIDNLLSADMVTANGDVLTVSENENSDLFWGIRGGGGNFGIVTSFEFQLHPVGPMVTLCAPFYPAEDANHVLTKWRDFMETAPDEFSSVAVFWSIPDDSEYPEETWGRRVVALAGVYCGVPEEGETLIQPLRELGTPLVDLSGQMPWTAIQSAFDPLTPKAERYYYYKCRYLKNLDDTTIEALIPRAVNPPASSTFIDIWHFGGEMQRVSRDKTAFMGREAPYLLSVDAVWDDLSQSDEVIAHAREYLSEMEPHSPGGLYVNFAGFGEEGEKLVKEAYGDHYQQLVALKNKYDPTNLFRLNQNIKPTA